MKKILKMQDLDCANCAAKMEDAVRKIHGVQSVSISFMTQKMIIELDGNESEKILKEVVKVCKKVEPDCEILIK